MSHENDAAWVLDDAEPWPPRDDARPPELDNSRIPPPPPPATPSRPTALLRTRERFMLSTELRLTSLAGVPTVDLALLAGPGAGKTTFVKSLANGEQSRSLRLSLPTNFTARAAGFSDLEMKTLADLEDRISRPALATDSTLSTRHVILPARFAPRPLPTGRGPHAWLSGIARQVWDRVRPAGDGYRSLRAELVIWDLAGELLVERLDSGDAPGSSASAEAPGHRFLLNCIVGPLTLARGPGAFTGLVVVLLDPWTLGREVPPVLEAARRVRRIVGEVGDGRQPPLVVLMPRARTLRNICADALRRTGSLASFELQLDVPRTVDGRALQNFLDDPRRLLRDWLRDVDFRFFAYDVQPSAPVPVAGAEPLRYELTAAAVESVESDLGALRRFLFDELRTVFDASLRRERP